MKSKQLHGMFVSFFRNEDLVNPSERETMSTLEDWGPCQLYNLPLGFCSFAMCSASFIYVYAVLHPAFGAWSLMQLTNIVFVLAAAGSWLAWHCS
jgi:hypothetical protein